MEEINYPKVVLLIFKAGANSNVLSESEVMDVI